MHTKTKAFLACLLGGLLLHEARAGEPSPLPESQYLLFQVWPAMAAYPGIPPEPGRQALSKSQMAGFVQSVIQAVGARGDARHKLGFAVGPFCFDISDDETRQWIRDAFAVARENDVAVAIHIDDSMSWGRRKDLIANPDNLETADWKQIPNTARSLAWGVKPSEFPPQMCYNAPAIVRIAKARAELIGAEIKGQLAAMQAEEKGQLFAGVIAGSETQISPEFGTNRRLGFRALAHRGFSEAHPPKDLDAERVSVVKEWMELWGNSLRAAGVPAEKIFCHIAFTDQGLRKADAKQSYLEKVDFAPAEVAFSTAYRPGFSTYPEGQTFQAIQSALAEHGSPGWISAEGTNVSPTGMPGESTMETYLARMFNHGAVMTNVFSWGIGGEAQRKNFFRQATENPEALAAYAKFLRGETLVESQGFSGPALQAKMRRIQVELPAWIQKTGRQAEAMALLQKVQPLMKERKWQEADQAANAVLALIEGLPSAPKLQAPTIPPSSPPTLDDPSRRVSEKVRRVTTGVRQWAASGHDPEEILEVMREKFRSLMDAGKTREAEAELDRLLEVMGPAGK
jgi:hypothetical protein